MDSCAAAALLKQSGFEVSCVNLLLSPSDLKDGSIAARRACEILSLPFSVLDLRKEFDSCVIRPFTEAYLRGLTPCPCAECNRLIKFGLFADYAREKGADRIATGHYASLRRKNGRVILQSSRTEKDQSYFLSLLSQEQLSFCLFPLSGLEKGQLREMLKGLGLGFEDKSDSQELCFVPDGSYADFIRKRTGTEPERGLFTDRFGRVLGEHRGIIYYTVGQRKGLGAFGEPMYVSEIRADENRIILAPQGGGRSKRFLLEKVNYISEPGPLRGEKRVLVKIRFQAKPAPARVFPLGGEGEKLSVEFDEPQFAVTPGQLAVLYDGDDVLAGGYISPDKRS